jgi:hypothetical protein
MFYSVRHFPADGHGSLFLVQKHQYASIQMVSQYAVAEQSIFSTQQQK